MLASLKKGYWPYIGIIVKLLIIYVVLLEAFYFYVGAIDPRGSVYWPWLAKYNLIQAILYALIYPTMWALELLGYATRHTDHSVGIMGGYGVTIAFPCLGIKIMIAYTALLFAFPGRKKMVFWILGILLIHFFNFLRILTIVLVFKHNFHIVMITHDLFNYVSYTTIILFFYMWYRKNHAMKSDLQ